MSPNTTSLIVTYISTVLAFVIIVTRLVFRYLRSSKLEKEDIWMGAAAIPLLLRLGSEHVILDFGTNIVVDTTNLSQRAAERMIIGSKLVLVCRFTSVVL